MLEAEVVGFAGTLGFWFALGLASPRLFLTQMSAIFKVKGGKKKEPNAVSKGSPHSCAWWRCGKRRHREGRDFIPTSFCTS